MNIATSRPSGTGRLLKWLVVTAVIALLILLRYSSLRYGDAAG